MSSNDLAIHVENVSMQFEMYEHPSYQLKQFLLPRLQRTLGLQPRQYFKPFVALDNISFEVKKGESVGIIGRNGSGKSTLLQIITGTLSPTSGQVQTYGRIAALLELGSGFNPEFTGRENVHLNGALLGLTQDQINLKFDSIASFADIGSHLDQPVKTYSSGMLVRLAFAVQVQVEPDILIVDEALAVGDALFQKRCFQQLEKLVSNGTSLLFVSHDQESIRTLTNRALLLRKGKLVDWGVSSEVVLKYRKLLHEEEISYFANLAQDMTERAKNTKAPTEVLGVDEVTAVRNQNSVQTAEGVRSDRLTFGDGEVKIIKVETQNAEGEKCSLFYPGSRIRIKVDCESFKPIDKLNVAVRIRNKEGVKIYSWGTLNQDMTANARNMGTRIFWHRQFQTGDTFQVLLECNCTLGENLYEIQAAVSSEGSMDYMSQRMLHWVDEAAFFQVSIKRDDYFFGGVTDLQMKASW